MPADEPIARPARAAGKGRLVLSVAVFLILVSGVGIRAYKDLSRPEAWAYWKDQYFSPSMTSALIASADPGRHGPTCTGGQRHHRPRRGELVPGEA